MQIRYMYIPAYGNCELVNYNNLITCKQFCLNTQVCHPNFVQRNFHYTDIYDIKSNFPYVNN